MPKTRAEMKAELQVEAERLFAAGVRAMNADDLGGLRGVVLSLRELLPPMEREQEAYGDRSTVTL